MSEYKKILQLIENVDPSDAGTLDEIDARVYYLGATKNLQPDDYNFFGDDVEVAVKWLIERRLPPEYTRSRDALKAIRPDGWFFGLSFSELADDFTTMVFCFVGENHRTLSRVKSKTLPTEELAELHAIIQAIEYDRQEKTRGELKLGSSGSEQ